MTAMAATSVTYQPLAALPNGSHTPVGLAWPVNPLYDIRLGELIALSESLAVATSQIAQFDNSQTGARPAIVVRIFNDNMFNLEYLGGMRYLDDQFLAAAKPVLDLIAMQSWAICHMRPGIELELHWIPGHGHQVEQHIWADRLAKEARNSGQPFSSLAGHN
ncbi:hypothetical protein NEMBOFW57_010912 [Staphylotrichum longicolle]|uniref:Uncharacterized protein n=1 Tax=Staphylotrichum longicolle TaxID=669026 RepID=A0AAD4HV67_9PEZI|nr:hypothetical protein NEMBOFW57_010912 [Staphylotrichum longicolle]